MGYSHLLVPPDGSELAERALRHITSTAKLSAMINPHDPYHIHDRKEYLKRSLKPCGITDLL